MMKNSRADATLFGFDFQVNAAIVLMLDNIHELKSLRLESKYEDIDIELVSGKHILAQAKSVVNSSSDFRNVRKNLKKALASLSTGSKKIQIEKLILITNSPNPLKEEASRSIFYGSARRDFATLPPSSKKIITDYLLDVEQPLNLDKFQIRVIPFETDDEAERYKVIWQEINNFIGEINIDLPGLGKKLHKIWCHDIFKNGSKKNAGIEIFKKELIWPLIVIVTDVDRIDADFRERFDSVYYDEIVRRYRELIDYCCERLEFFTKILYDYNEYSHSYFGKDGCIQFTAEKWEDYSSEIEIDGLEDEIVEGLTKVIIYNIIRRRYDINRIKQGVSL
ncbi:MAG: hypothetical protein GX963_10360 [Bacteroidales bacterium]|nr:hypothetical protein [Bacteroidales bacterium]